MALPYWQVNIPEDQRVAECPAFLRSLSAKDERIISTLQDDYKVMSWPEVKSIVSRNDLGAFQRDPLALRRYLEYTWGLKAEYGSVVNYVLKELLRWDVAELSTIATTEQTVAELTVAMDKPYLSSQPSSNLRILRNDWPYGIDERIVHLVAWTKFGLAEDPETGDLTDGARASIEAYVQALFGELGKDNVGFMAVPCTYLCASCLQSADLFLVHLVQELVVA